MINISIDDNVLNGIENVELGGIDGPFTFQIQIKSTKEAKLRLKMWEIVPDLKRINFITEKKIEKSNRK